MPIFNKNTGIGVGFSCILKINDIPIVTANIISLIIREWVFELLPRIEIILKDDGTLSELYPIVDGSKIYVELSRNENDENGLKQTFRVLAVTSGSMVGNRSSTIQIIGALDINEFYAPSRNRSFSTRSSFEVINQIISREGGKSIETKTGFSTNDLMTWLQIHQTNLEMVKHVLKRAYKPKDSIFLYGRTDGTFVFTSLHTELEKEVSKTAKYDVAKYKYESFDNTADLNNLWFSSFSRYDVSMLANIMRNYGVSFHYYDTKDGHKTEDITESDPSLAAVSTKDKIYDGQNTETFDFKHLSKNVHENYYKSIVQNDYYRHNFMSGYMLELMINPISDVKLFDMINCFVPSIIAAGSNEPYSGKYGVVGIVHEAKIKSQYIKRLHLCRNATEEIKVTT